MKACILMIGNTARRHREAIIQASIFKQSGLGLTVNLISGTDEDAVKSVETAVKSGASIIVIDDDNLHTDYANKYLTILNDKYQIRYRITDGGTYNLPSGFDIKSI